MVHKKTPTAPIPPENQYEIRRRWQIWREQHPDSANEWEFMAWLERHHPGLLPAGENDLKLAAIRTALSGPTHG